MIASPVNNFKGEDKMEDRIKAIGILIAADKFEHCTADPIFLVQQKSLVYGTSDGFQDGHVWVDNRTGEECDERKSKRLDRLNGFGRVDEGKYRWCGYKVQWVFVTACFTEEGAKEFIQRQKHNLKETRIWVDSLFRNQEMIDVREYLKSKSSSV